MTLLLIVGLLTINAFFVAAEFALVKARNTKIDSLVTAGRLGASVTKKIQQDLEAHLAACQLGITMASLGLGWVGEPFVAALLEPLLHSFELSESTTHTISFSIGFLIFSSLHITVGEQVPKTFAIRKAETVSLWVAYPLRLFFLVFYPLNIGLNFISRSMLHVLGVQEAPHAEIYSSEEIEDIVSTSTEHGEIGQDKGKMLNNMFRFDQLRVGRVMMPFNQVKCLDTAAPPKENINTIKTTGHSRFPLINKNNNNELIGLILAKDLYNAMLEGESNPWKDLKNYCRKTLVVSENQSVSGLFDQMREKKAHFAFVVDEYGNFVGVVTIEDLLEEIVGDIEDETDIDIGNIRSVLREDGVWEVSGLIPLVDLERQIGLQVDPTLDVNTLSGLITERLSRMPEVADCIEEGNYIITVQSIANRHVESATLVEKIFDHPDIQETEV